MNRSIPDNKKEEQPNRATDSQAAQFSSLDRLLRPSIHTILKLSRKAMEQTDPEQQRRYLTRVQTSGQQLLHRLDILRDLARLEQGTLALRPRNFQLLPLLNELSQEIDLRLAERPVKFRMDVDTRLPAMMHGDPERVRQLILCFTDNAIRFTQEGEIHLQVRLAARNRSSIRLHCTIEDSGPGLPPELALNPFSPTAKSPVMPNSRPAPAGTGLRMARLLARLMNGDAGIITSHSPGSAFWFSLQLAPAQPPESGGHTRPEPRTLSRRETAAAQAHVQPILHLKPGLDPDARQLLDLLYSALLQEDFNSLELVKRHEETLKRLLGADALRLRCVLDDFDFRRARAILEATCSRKR